MRVDLFRYPRKIKAFGNGGAAFVKGAHERKDFFEKN